MTNRDCTKIVLTGGPCGGKTTSLVVLAERLKELGVKAFFIPEVASLMINGGFKPWKMKDKELLSFQENLLRLQMQFEDSYYETIKHIESDKPKAIICDRGTLDGKAFINENLWRLIMEESRWNSMLLGGRYDSIIHLATAADGAEESYNFDNPARSESPEKALEVDRAIRQAWIGHESFKFIDNSTDFETKIDRVIKSVCNTIGIPDPLEIERRFLVKKSDWLNSRPDIVFANVEIEQIYLKTDEPGIHRIRKRGSYNSFVYYKTTKLPNNIEKQRQISGREYYDFLAFRDLDTKPVRKTRRCFIANGFVFELDIYDSPKLEYDILEVELSSFDTPVKLPEEIEVVKEITGDKEWSNYSLSRK